MLDRTAQMARTRAEEYKWRTLLGETIADCVTTRLRSIPEARLIDASPHQIVGEILGAFVHDQSILHGLARAYRWELARRDAVTPSPDLSYPRPRGATP